MSEIRIRKSNNLNTEISNKKKREIDDLNEEE